MSNVQPELINRAKLCEALRSGKHKQQRHTIGNYQNKNAPVCVYGVLYRIFNLPIAYKMAERLIGLSYGEGLDIVDKNDNKGYTFTMLADYIETLPLIKETANG